MVLLPLVAMDFCSKFMAHEDLFYFYGLQIFEGTRYFTLDEVTRNYGWALHGDVELNSFANISSNICSVLGVPICFFYLLGSVSILRRLQWILLTAGAVGNGIESVLFRSVTDFIHIHDTGTFLDDKVANLADLYLMSGMAVVLLECLLKLLLPATQDTGFSDGPKRKRFIYTKKQTQEVRERYQNGDSLEEIALLSGTSVPSIRGKLVHAGVYVSRAKHHA